MRVSNILFLSCLGLALLNSVTSLEVIESGILPSRRQAIRSVFDGIETIPILGGSDTEISDYTDEVLKFNTSSWSVELVARFPNGGVSYGVVAQVKDGSIYYISGVYSDQSIYRLSFEEPEPIKVAELPFNHVYKPAGAYDGDNTIYILGGYNDDRILKFDLSTYETAEIGKLPVPTSTGSAVWYNKSIYVFGGDLYNYNNQVIKYTPSSGKSEILNGTLPRGLLCPSAVRIGETPKVGIIGGMAATGNPRHDLTVYDFNTQVSTENSVPGYPDSLFCTSAVHVPNQNRIYTFGGGSKTDGDKIFSHPDKIYL